MTTHNGEAPPAKLFPDTPTAGEPHPLLNDPGFRRFVANTLASHQQWLRRAIGGDPRRDLDDECGYDPNPTTQSYEDLYDREPIAAKVVAFWPNETWQVSPSVYEDEDADVNTPFEKAWDALGRELAGEDGLFKSEEGNPIWEYLRRVDILSGIGCYGVLLLGLDDGLPLDQPVVGLKEMNSYPVGKNGGNRYKPSMNRVYSLTTNAKQTTGRKLLYLRAFPESLAPIVRYETNMTSPRFGQPTMYRLSLNEPRDYGYATAQPTATVYVHWSRVIHVADTYHQACSSEIMAIPRLKPVLNPIVDIRKVRGSSAEMYYKGAFPGYSLETTDTEMEMNDSSLRDLMEKYINGLQRYAIWDGMTMKSLAPQVVDPTAQIEVQEKAISAAMDVPWRIWQGSERGELASSQDQKRHNKNVACRQNRYATPRQVLPLVGRCVLVGVLPRPEQVCCDWPEIASMTELEKAQVSLAQTQTDAAYMAGGVEALIPPRDYLTRVRGFTEEEAEAMLEAAVERHAEVLTQEIDDTLVKVDAGVMPDPAAPPEPAFNASADAAPEPAGEVSPAINIVNNIPALPPQEIHYHTHQAAATPANVTVNVPEQPLTIENKVVLPDPNSPRREVRTIDARDEEGNVKQVTLTVEPLAGDMPDDPNKEPEGA